MILHRHRLVGLPFLLEDKPFGRPAVPWQRPTEVLQRDLAASRDVDVPGRALVVVHGGAFDGRFAVEEFLKPHAGALGYVVEHERVQCVPRAVRRALRPFRIRNLAEGNRAKQEQQGDMGYEASHSLSISPQKYDFIAIAG